ncbi:MAG: hypothetical protein ACFCU7_14945 [Pleurocapsa sp.]
MTTLDIASAVNSPSQTRFIEEISIIIAAQDLTPTMMSQDFLKFSGIIPQEWELSQQPVLNPNFAQLNFTNGVGINAQPGNITLSESLNNRKLEQLAIRQVAGKYVEKLPHAEYMGLSFSPKILLPFPEAPASVRQYITETLLASGSWKRIGKAPVQAGINLMYLLERCQLTISISEARLQKPQEQPITAILFSGNFNYNVNLGQQSEDRIAQVTNFLNNWEIDIEEFRAIVNQKFLDSGHADSSQSIGETSLFPGQTL